MVPEIQEIDDFFDSLNPNIEVIWGISTDNTIGEDAKVTILATGTEMQSFCVAPAEQADDCSYYERQISKVYRTFAEAVEPSPEAATPEATPAETVPEEGGPAEDPADKPADEPRPVPRLSGNSLKEKFMQWVNEIMNDDE